jgi:RNA polymerase sigma factor (sigma-70 family)
MDETLAAAAPAARRSLNAQQAEELVIAVITRHADAVLRTARRHSLCADDAQDAYQRALEILVRHAHRLDPERAGSWLHTVVKHEAMAVRRSRSRLVGMDEMDLDALEANTTSTPEERALQFEHTMRSAEALKRLKPQEVRALWLKAAGHSYRDICEVTGWTYTKVNRCLTEGRRTFLERYAGIEAGEECARWEPVLSAMVDGEATGDQLVELRPHLRNCASCRATLRALHTTGTSLGALFPPATLALSATDLEHAGGFLARLYETVSMTVHERMASTVLRIHSVVETATAHKAAAIAASAVAVAGGGLAVDEARRLPEPARAIAERSTPGEPASVTRRSPAVPLATRSSAATASTRRVLQRTSVRPKSSKPSRAASRPVSEPLVDPVESRTTTAPAPVVARPAQALAMPRATGPASPARTPSSEFGFEKP